MAKKGGRGRAGPQRVKGFRPGKEPAHLRKQHAKAQLPSDASWAQKQMVEAIAGRSPQEVRSLVRRWVLLAATVAGVLAVGGIFLYTLSVVAGVVVHVLAAGAGFLAFRLRGQSPDLEEMAKRF